MDEYKIKDDIDINDLLTHLSVLDEITMDPYLEKFTEIHGMIVDHLHDAKPTFTDWDVATHVAVFVDFLGSEYPEAGLGTVSIGLNRILKSRMPKAKRDKYLNSIIGKIDIMKDVAPKYKQIRQSLVFVGNLTYMREILRRFFYWPKGSEILKLVEMIAKAVENRYISPMDSIRLKRYIMLLNAIAYGGLIIRKLQEDEVKEMWIVSIDMRHSQIVNRAPDGEHWKDYTLRVVAAWAQFMDAYFINHTGNEAIYGFEKEEQALGYAAAASVHSREIGKVCLDDTGWGVGISRGRIVRRNIGGNANVVAASGAPYDAIAYACSASKGHIGIRIKTSQNVIEIDPIDTFERSFLFEVVGMIK